MSVLIGTTLFDPLSAKGGEYTYVGTFGGARLYVQTPFVNAAIFDEDIMLLIKNGDITTKWPIMVRNSTSLLGATGAATTLGANAYIGKQGGSLGAVGGTFTEDDSTKAPGLYLYTPASGETNTNGGVRLTIPVSTGLLISIPTPIQVIAFDLTSSSVVASSVTGNVGGNVNGNLVGTIGGTAVPLTIDTTSAVPSGFGGAPLEDYLRNLFYNGHITASSINTVTLDVVPSGIGPGWELQLYNAASPHCRECRVITGVSGSVVTADQDFLNGVPPVGSASHVWFAGPKTPYAPALQGGLAAAGGASTITLSSTADGTNNTAYIGAIVQIYGGTGVGSYNVIKSYVAATKVATMSRPWPVTPDTTSCYMISVEPSGNLDAAGNVDSNTAKWLGTTVATPGTAGVPSVDAIRWATGVIPAPNVTGVPKSDVVDWLGSAPNALVSGRVDASLGSVTTDTTAPGNIALAFNGTGYSAPTAPAQQQQVANIAVTGAALNATAASATYTTGSSTGGYTNTFAEDGSYDSVTDTAGTLDFFYGFDLSATSGAAAVEAAWEGYVIGILNTVKVYAYNWGNAAYDQIGTVVGISGTANMSETWDLTSAHTGTGFNLGLVRIRFNATGLTSSATKTDRILLGYAVVPASSTVIAGAVWDVATASHTTAGTYGLATPANVTEWLGTAAATPATAGVPSVDPVTWKGGTIPTPTVTGVPKVDMVDILGTAVATPTVAGIPKVEVSTIDTNAITSSAVASGALASQAVASVSGAVGSVTGAVGSVTGNVGGSVASIATGGISDSSFATTAITALGVVRRNTAQAGSATSITLDSGATVDVTNGIIYIVSGTGAGQFRSITAYNTSTKVATVATWGTNPDNTSVFAIFAGSAAGSTGPTAATIASAVWEEPLASHSTASTFGVGVPLAAAAASLVVSTLMAFSHDTGLTIKGAFRRMDALAAGAATGLVGTLAKFFMRDGTTAALTASQVPTAGTRSTADVTGSEA